MKKILTLIALSFITLSSCTDGTRAKFESIGSKHKVEIVNGGQIVRTYISTGVVSSELHTDGYYFEDEATHKLTKVSGQVIITQL